MKDSAGRETGEEEFCRKGTTIASVKSIEIVRLKYNKKHERHWILSIYNKYIQK